MKAIVLIAILFLTSLAAAQTLAVQPPTPKPVPQLSELEKLKIENLQLRFEKDAQAIQQISQDQAGIRNQFQTLKTDIEKEYPGYTVEPTGNSEPNLIPKPTLPPAAPTPKPAAPEVKK